MGFGVQTARETSLVHQIGLYCACINIPAFLLARIALLYLALDFIAYGGSLSGKVTM